MRWNAAGRHANFASGWYVEGLVGWQDRWASEAGGQAGEAGWQASEAGGRASEAGGRASEADGDGQ